eukprot:CAMPEP_0201520438 /NCGR_PEP_ID=MMETSP0161_2-20130828/11283_1 /ASSEMBLY_ACC=CAM_ASM_000251 /TAXON_ID=180227 /ORGANISM="Neoparamoeba aestuarina, Strain SoJaBio B1-5/56/2" /LENGTH=122 /DNA_ID=CAMNT_0047918811 /DNA_START=27 /DNA_END=392 /DNA_ORIENTATION=+
MFQASRALLRASRIQDVPPPGGFPPFSMDYTKPLRGISGTAAMGVIVGMTVFGLALVKKTKNRQKMERCELMQTRWDLCPLLQTEADKRILHQIELDRLEEVEVMKEFPEWMAGESPYKTRW